MRTSLLLLTLAASAAALSAQAAGVEISPATASVVAGQAVRFTAVARDSLGRPMAGAKIRWAATPFDVAAMDSTGRLVAFRQGRVTVFAIAGGRPGVATVEIRPKPPAKLDLELARPAIVVGDATVATALPRTEDGEPRRDVPVAFRSQSPDVAAVTEGGAVIGRKPGTATITATAGDARAAVSVRVVANPVARLAVTGPGGARTGDVVRLTARAEDARGRPASGAPVRWSVSGRGADVDPDGAFVAEAPGTYLVTASAGTVAATHAIQVAPRVHARRVELVTFRPFGDVQAAEHWAIGDVLYTSTVSDRVYAWDISNAASPALVDSITVDARIVNDVSTTADGRIGVMTREGASSRKNGLVFLDLSDRLHPKVLSEYTETVTGGVHSAYVDGHYVYATDDATGSLRVISFADPRKPREVARWEVPERNLLAVDMGGQAATAGRMLHDVQVKDGLAYLAYWRHGLVILDVGAGIQGGSPERPQLVSQFVYNVADYYPPDMIAGTHSVFRARNYVFVGDEVFPGLFDLQSRERIKTLGRVHVIDVSDLARPRKVAEYHARDLGAHNFWVENDVLYIGYYEGGLRVVDVSGELQGDLMAQGREIGAVWTGSPKGFRPNLPMAWGAQPHKGHIYVTDINSGLWVARLTPSPIP